MQRIITHQQALDSGLTRSAIRHRVETGRWQRIFTGVYATYEVAIPWRDRLKAATLARGPGALASLECALNLWHLSDREPGILTLAEPHATHRHRALNGVRVRRRRRLVPARRHGIPVTSLAQTVLHVLGEPGAELDSAMALVSRAVRRRDLRLQDLREEFEHHPRHPFRVGLDEVLTAAEEGLGSAAERRYATEVEAAHGLPRMERQGPIDGLAEMADGRCRFMDFRDSARRLRLEIDGELYHRDKQREDRARDREAVAHGDVTLRAGWAELVGSPCQLAGEIAAAQIARGWTGRPRPCGPTCGLATSPRWRRIFTG